MRAQFECVVISKRGIKQELTKYGYITSITAEVAVTTLHTTCTFSSMFTNTYRETHLYTLRTLKYTLVAEFPRSSAFADANACMYQCVQAQTRASANGVDENPPVK